MSRSQSETADLICPTCGNAFSAEVWLVVDRQERPDLIRSIMDGELNVAFCPHCGAEGGVNHPLLLHDAARQQVLVALPLTVQGEAAARELVGELLTRLLDQLAPDERKPYLGEIELVPELDGLRALLIEQALGDEDAAQDQLVAIAVQDLLNVSSEEDFQRVIAQHRTLLLSDRAVEALEHLRKDARRAGDQELRRRVQEVQAVLGRFRSILANRRRTLNMLLDELAPLSDDELAVLPQLRQMLDAIDPQEVYRARISLGEEQRATLDHLIERLADQAGHAQQTEALLFLRTLSLLPQQ